MEVHSVRGALYVEDYTDINILPAWATQLGHRAEKLLATEAMVRHVVFQTRARGADNAGVRSRDHFRAQPLVRENLPGLELLDGDAHPGMREGAITSAGLQRLRWRRCEIKSYLLHPESLVRFVTAMAGGEAAGPRVEDMLGYWRDEFPPVVIREPLGEHDFLNATKARIRLLPPVLAARIHGFPGNRFHEIAQTMRREEIHPEVPEKLDAICRAFGVEP